MSKKGLEAKSSGSKPATESTPLIVEKNEGGGGGDGSLDKDGSSGGLSMKQAALLVAGEMAGSGVLALPRALVKTGWIGVPLMVVMCAAAAFSGKRLGDCWSIIEDRDPAMRTKKRNPYAIIADQTLGRTWSVVVSMAIIVTQFGAAVVYLLLAAQILGLVLLSLLPTLTICSWYLVVVGVMTPLMFFGSPKDFKWTGVLAFGSAVLACVFYFIEMMNDIRPFVFRWGIHGFQDFFLALGIIMFAFGGAASFPTIQNDMADKTHFSKSLHYSFIAILALYLPIAAGGYAVYGDAAAANIAASLAATPLTLLGHVLMALHLVLAFIILINPVCQEVEELYNVPRDSTGYRMGVRLSVMAGVLFIGESVPRFYTILSLVGGSSVALLTLVLPPLCYLSLANQTPRDGQTPVEASGVVKLLCYEVLFLGAVGGAGATWAALSAIFSTAQATPCYL